jgi:hypothetical protein
VLTARSVKALKQYHLRSSEPPPRRTSTHAPSSVASRLSNSHSHPRRTVAEARPIAASFRT